MADRVIHISEAGAASDFAGLLARVRAGAEIVIESDKLPAAVVRPAEPHVRLLSESLRLAKEHASRATLDAERRGDTVEQLIEKIVKATGDQESALSAIGYPNSSTAFIALRPRRYACAANRF